MGLPFHQQGPGYPGGQYGGPAYQECNDDWDQLRRLMARAPGPERGYAGGPPAVPVSHPPSTPGHPGPSYSAPQGPYNDDGAWGAEATADPMSYPSSTPGHPRASYPAPHGPYGQYHAPLAAENQPQLQASPIAFGAPRLPPAAVNFGASMENMAYGAVASAVGQSPHFPLLIPSPPAPRRLCRLCRASGGCSACQVPLRCMLEAIRAAQGPEATREQHAGSRGERVPQPGCGDVPVPVRLQRVAERQLQASRGQM
ncbi:hypothetical protein GGR50DRAFT_691256 [Xylaria sp. CBS 124048]|nr:hypothetical protein GGR50DRAFT_691256 [Xylaria sp. CBS 124048]